MPRVKAIRGEIGTSGVIRTVSISGNANLDLAEAVELEHSCEANTCDIGWALHCGYPQVAASLLGGATECPLVEAVAAFYGIPINGDIRKLEDWNDWLEWFKENARECDCGAYVLDEDSSYCDNCGGEVPKGEA
jgi:hypothetical protein